MYSTIFVRLLASSVRAGSLCNLPIYYDLMFLTLISQQIYINDPKCSRYTFKSWSTITHNPELLLPGNSFTSTRPEIRVPSHSFTPSFETYHPRLFRNLFQFIHTRDYTLNQNISNPS